MGSELQGLAPATEVGGILHPSMSPALKEDSLCPARQGTVPFCLGIATKAYSEGQAGPMWSGWMLRSTQEGARPGASPRVPRGQEWTPS